MMDFVGAPVVINDDTVVQFARNRHGHVLPFRIAVCIEHPDKHVMFFDDGDCGPHFRWATPADIDRIEARGAALEGGAA